MIYNFNTKKFQIAIKTVAILICFIFIFEDAGYPCPATSCKTNLRVPVLFGKRAHETDRPHQALPEVSGVADLSSLEIAMLGNMIHNPKAIAGLPQVRASIHNPAYLYHAMKVYLYDPAFFERLIKEGVSEEVIDDIGWSVGHNPEGLKLAIDNDIPFLGLWKIRETRGFSSGENTACLFDLNYETIEAILQSPFRQWAVHGNFVAAFREYPLETKRLMDEFKVNPDRENIYVLARIMSRHPEVCEKILGDSIIRTMNYTTLNAIENLMCEHNKPFDDIRDVLISFDKTEWEHFTTYGDQSPSNYLMAFLTNKTQATRLHKKYPYKPAWLEAFEVLASGTKAQCTSYDELAQLGYPEDKIDFNVIKMYELNAEFLKWMLEVVGADFIESLAWFLAYNIKDKNSYLEVIRWLKNSGLIVSGARRYDIEKIIEIYISEIYPQKLSNSKWFTVRERSFNWALSFYTKGLIGPEKVKGLYGAYLSYEQGVLNALRSGMRISAITASIAEIFQKDPNSTEARTALDLNELGVTDINTDLIRQAIRYREVVLSLREAGVHAPYLDTGWLRLLHKEAEKGQDFIKLLKELMAFDGFEFFYNRVPNPSISLREIIPFVEKLIRIAQEEQRPLSKRDIARMIVQDRIKYANTIFSKKSYSVEELKLLFRDLCFTEKIYALNTGFEWFPFSIHVHAMRTGVLEIGLCVSDDEIEKLAAQGYKLFTGKHSFGSKHNMIVTMIVQMEGNSIMLRELQTNIRYEKTSPYLKRRYKDSLAIGLFMFEHMFEDAKIIVPLSAGMIQNSNGHINSSTAYNVYYRIPYEMGYAIQKLDTNIFRDCRGRDEDLFWMKELHGDTPRPLRDILLEQKRTNSGLLRLPLETGKAETQKKALRLYVRERFEELRKRYGSKAAWLIILKELKLDEKLGFIIPDFVCFEHEEAKAIYDRWENQDVESMLGSINEKIGKIIGDIWTVWSIEHRRERIAHSFELEIYLRGLYRLEVPDEEFRKHLEPLFEKEFAPLLKYATKEEWIDFFTAIRQSYEIKRLINNKKQRYSFPEASVNEEIRQYLREAIESFLFYNTLSEEEKERLQAKLGNLPMRLIARASGLGEDIFETAMAGRYGSKTVDKFTWLYGLVFDMSQQIDTYTGEFTDCPHTVFIQEFIPAQKSGMVFSNLCGYTTIECVVGDGSMATAGVNNTIVDLNKDGGVEDVYYGSSAIEEGVVTISWDGLELVSELGTLDMETMQRIWNDNTSEIKDTEGRVKKSPFSQKEIQKARRVALALEEILGFPVDDEICFKAGKLYLVQNRPITGLNSPMPEPLPEFKEKDIIEKVPISIGKTPKEGFLGYLVAFEDADNEERCARYVSSPLFNPGVGPDTAMIVTRSQPLVYAKYNYKVVINSKARSRIYHHGIRFREKNMVVAGILNIETGKFPNLEWKQASIVVDREKMKFLISTQKVRYFSNGFRGVLVRGDAVPLRASDEELYLSLQRTQRDDL